MNELLQAAKDEAAMEAGYNTFEELLSVDGYLSDNTTLINRAMEIYAEMLPCNHPFDKVVQNNGDCVCFKCGHKIK